MASFLALFLLFLFQNGNGTAIDYTAAPLERKRNACQFATNPAKIMTYMISR